MLLRLALATLLATRTVSASLFPTFPTARSVLGAGRLITLRWIDDEEWPSIYIMGPCRIDLFVGYVSRWVSKACGNHDRYYSMRSQTYVTNLAEDVDPKFRAADVWVSPAWRHNGSNLCVTISPLVTQGFDEHEYQLSALYLRTASSRRLHSRFHCHGHVQHRSLRWTHDQHPQRELS